MGIIRNSYVLFKLCIGYENTTSYVYYAQVYNRENKWLLSPLHSQGEVLLQGIHGEDRKQG